MTVWFFVLVAVAALAGFAAYRLRHAAKRQDNGRRALVASEQRYRAVFESAAFGHAVSDTQGRLLEVNAAYCRLVGYSADELRAGGFQQVTHPDDVAQDRAALGRMLRGEFDHYVTEKRYVHRDGHFIWGLLSVVPLRDGSGRISGFHVQVVDISAHKRAEAALAASEERFALAVSGARDGIYDVDLVRNRMWLSERWHELFGHTRQGESAELPFPTVMGWILPQDRSAVEAALARHLAGGEPFDAEFRVRAADGRTVWVRSRAQAVRDAEGRAVRVVGAVTDVNAQKEHEAEVRRNLAEQEALRRELAELTYTIAHDLRAPLRHVHGYATLLADEAGAALNAEGRRLLERINEAGRLMGRLVDALLDFAQMSRAELTPGRVDLDALTRALVARHETPGRRVEWRLGPLSAVWADVRLLRRALEQLLDNALRHTAQRAPAIISVATRREDGMDIISVSDNGAGFDPAQGGSLFNLFTRLPQGNGQGLGVGLAMVRRIAERHGGRAWCRAAVDAGAEFSLSLPVHPEATRDNPA